MRRLLLLLAAAVCIASPVLAKSRVKDIAVLQSARDNQLVGYGLVVGLQGTGDRLAQCAVHRAVRCGRCSTISASPRREVGPG